MIKPVVIEPRAAKSNAARYWRAFRRNPAALFGFVIILMMTLGAIFADFLAPHDPLEPHYADRLVPPSAVYPLGTDELGRDIFSRLLYGARISLMIGFVAQAVILTIGIPIGLMAGWYGGWVDDLLMRFTDVFFAIPSQIFLIVWVTIFEPSTVSIFLALGLVNWPASARLIRGQVLAIKNFDHITAAQALGAPTLHILWQHVLPNTLAALSVVAVLGIAGTILSESILSFLGLGIQIPSPSWGTMTDLGKNYLATGKWWYAFFPGLTITLTVVGFNFLGDGLRNALDPLQQ